LEELKMRRSEHIEFAQYVAIQIYYEETRRIGIQTKEWQDIVAMMAAEWIGENIGTLPDWLEPGINQYHRKIFHSKDVYNEIEKWKQKIRSNPSNEWWWSVSFIMALSAYQSHILLDSTTPMGVPEYGWIRRLLESFKSKKGGNVLLP
jgi:hypothetical protein